MFLYRFPKQAYLLAVNKMQELNVGYLYFKNWSYCVKRFLDLFGFSEVWVNDGMRNEHVFLKE